MRSRWLSRFREILIACVLSAALLVGCSAPAATPLSFSKEQAIARAMHDAKQSEPGVGIRQARVDSVMSELMTLAEADQRAGGQRGPGGYAPGQTPQSPVWWVTVRGYFQYESMAMGSNPPPICEADEHDFIYDVHTGEEVGGPIPNARCAPDGLSRTATPGLPLAPTPHPFPRTLHDEIESALVAAERSGSKMLCEWEVLGQSKREMYVWFYCESEFEGGSAQSAPAVVYLTEEGHVSSIQVPRDGSYYGPDIRSLFPVPVQQRIFAHPDNQALAARISSRRTQQQAQTTVPPAPTAAGYSPWMGTPAVGSPPRSDQPLPQGISNGDLIECHLLWFIWENTKSRIWFPNTAPAEWFAKDPSFGNLRDGPDATGKLTGVLNSTRDWYIIATTTPDYKEAEQVFLVDPANRIRYPVNHKKVTFDICAVIPTAAGEQYDPALLSH